MKFLEDRKFNKIAHLADIHIRLYKRHKEYKNVFKNLYKQLKEQNAGDDMIICVVGDIVHSKTDMSPELVSLVSEFFSNLSDIAPVVIAAGNHDLNLANPHRMDSLSPIIENIARDNVFYFRDSGIYTVGNIDFSMYSIIGENKEWITSPPFSTNIPIALYHGPVYSATTDLGYTITDRHVDISAFENYPITLLGDIHKFQELPSVFGKVVYPGSLIQQNHGENLNGHGWVLWNLNENSYQHIETPNDYGYVTIRATSENPLEIPNLPKNVRLRLITEGFDSSGIRQLISLLKKKLNIIELSINQLNSTGVSEFTGGIGFDPHDVNAQNTWITEYIQNNFSDTSTKSLETIININKKLNSKIQDEELPRNIHWKPLHLKFDNLFSYGDGNEIDFSSMSGLYGLFSPNAHGKSSALEAVSFALYDKTPRAFKGNHIMNTRKNRMYCKLEFMVDQNHFVIERIGKRKKNNDVKVDVNFYQIQDGEKISLNGEDRRATNANIRTYVGTYEDFILTTLSVQNQNSIFIDTGQSERKDLLSQFIGLTIFDRLYSLATDETRELSGLIKFYNQKDHDEELEIMKEKSSFVEKKLEVSEGDLESIIETQKQFETSIRQLYEKKINGILDMDIGPILKNIENIEPKIIELEQNLEKNKSLLEEGNEKYLRDRNDFEIKYRNSSEDFKKYQEVSLLYSDSRRKLDLLENDIKTKKDKLDKLSEHKYDPECEFCINNIFVKDAIDTEKKYQELLELFPETKKNFEFYENEKNSLSHIPDIINEKDSEYLSLDRKKQFLDNLSSKISQIEDSIVKLRNDLDANLKLKKIYEENEENIALNKKIDIEINELEIKKKSADDLVKEINASIRRLSGELLIINNNIETLRTEIQQREENEQLYSDYELYLHVIGRDGLPYELIGKIIPQLQKEVNNILSQMVEFSVSLDVDGKNINGKIIYDDQRQWPLELASGMEKFITGLAIRVALTKVSSLPKPNFLIVDEGFGVLDRDNLSSMSMMFDVLKNSYEFIIMISHLDSMRDLVDNIIEIHRSDGFSKINV